MIRTRHVILVLLTPLALVAGTVGHHLTDTVHPLADPSDNFGQPLEPFGSSFAVIWSLVVAAALVLAGATLMARPDSQLHKRRRLLTVVAAVLALLTLDHTLLMLLGYLPMVAVRVLTGDLEPLGDLASPGLGIQVAVAAGIAGLLLAARASAQGVAGGRPSYTADDLHDATARTRRWTHIAMEAPLVYAASRILMFFEAPGFRADGFDFEVRVAGLGLAAASIVGATLTWGLVRPWGERFPRWMVGLAGRRVPVDLAVVSALVVAALIMAASRAVLIGGIEAGEDMWREQLENPLIGLPQLLWPLWSVALALAALAYQRRRRIADQEHGELAVSCS